jgi:hypothetical protein
MMDCPHAAHARDPSDRAVRRPFLVCLACGMLGVPCDRCTRFYPTPPLGYVPDIWCRACDCCPACCTDVDGGLTPADVIDAIERSVHAVADSWIVRSIRAAPTRVEATKIAHRECSKGGVSRLGFSLSGFRDRINKGRGLTVEVGHRKGVVTWTQIADYVRAPAPLARSAVPAQQLPLFG